MFYVKGYEPFPIYAGNLSNIIGSLVEMYTPGAGGGGDYCYAVRNNDVIEEHFTITVQDACGEETEIPVTVRIKPQDTTPPKIKTPAQDKTVECDGKGNLDEFNAWLASHGGAVASDVCCGNNVTWSNDYTGPFPYTCGKTGSVTVTFTATDCCGNSSKTKATFTIQDTTPPVLTAPADRTIECDEPTDPSYTGEATAKDTCDPNPTVSYTDHVVPCCCIISSTPPAPPPPPCCDCCQDGKTCSTGYLPVGCAQCCPQAKVIKRTWTATDACGHSSSATQIITVVDTTAPTVSLSGTTVHTNDPNATGATVNYSVSVHDNCDPSPKVVCTPPPGSWFPVGTSMVTCTATDACGNTESYTFTVEVIAP